MPKIIEYPRASLRSSLELARHVSELGGEARAGTVAEKMGARLGGAFAALIGAAVKFTLVVHSSGIISTTSLYREYKLAYSEEDGTKALQKAFLAVPLFQKLYQRFLKQKLPVDILSKLLAREFEVDEGISSRVAGYFLEGARAVKLLDDQNIISPIAEEVPNSGDIASSDFPRDLGDSSPSETYSASEQPPATFYCVEFSGPGINSKISLRETEDLEIVEATLKQIRRKMGGTTLIPPT